MTPEDWQTAKDLLLQSLELPPAERARFLDERGLSPEILGEVRSLLKGEADAERVMGVSAAEYAADLLTWQNEGPEGTRVGAYVIEREIGGGGMGTVYLARRDDGKFTQRVAIKMLRRELNATRVRQIFEREKNIQARLEHPGIAKMLDAGATDDGVPYFAMEFVEGLPIDEYCEANSLGLPERLKLFAKVCDAVASSHQNLIVHRDLKPSNILVKAGGQPKVLDFGISKLLDADDHGDSVTLLGAMTPEYASPEQIAGQAVTTASDVYSLGIVLFKLLTGSHPFPGRKKANGNLDLATISEEEPPAPSGVVRQNSETAIRDDQLKGDLDNIVLKAIRSSPEERYHSVEQLSQDIWRYFDGMPVHARPATRLYRIGKFYRRNKLAVTAGILIFASLVAGISVSAWQTRAARANAALAAAESENARAEQKKAEKISRFMMRIISYASPNWDAAGHKFAGETRVVDALADLESKIETEFAGQPDVLAELHHQFADVFLRRGGRSEEGSLARARKHAVRALELRRSFHGEWHELVAKDLVYVFWTRPAASGTTDEDVAHLSQAIEMMRRTNPKNLNLPYMLETYWHRLSSDAYASTHDLFFRHVPLPAPPDKYLAADQLFDEMLEALRLHFVEDDVQIVTQKCRGMLLKLRAGKAGEAEEFYRACEKAGEAVPKREQDLEAFRKLAGN